MSWFRKEKPKPPLAAVTEQLGSVPVLRIGAVVGGLVLLWGLSQIILAAATAAVSLAVIGLIGIAGIALFQALPLLAQKWENRLLAARKQEARKNPIEQAENDLLRRTQQYDAFKAAVATIGGLISALKTELVGMKKESPDSDFSSEAEAVKKMDL
ncbi:MAG TPA: hypothetical protein VHD38_00145, partial [Candidatus Paceibacterota bacterium]|nr:hypothetical protein [Candidatus Paceibacterota bacterium]